MPVINPIKNLKKSINAQNSDYRDQYN